MYTQEKRDFNIPSYMEGNLSNSPSIGWPTNYQPIYDFNTPNKSFIEVQQQLEMLGVKNNAFHLILLNPLLQGIDPFDESLPPEYVLMVIQECKLNMFYYLREVVRIPEDGGASVSFRLDRGTLAAAYCFYNNINFYLMKPRQTGKTVAVQALLSWAFKFSGPNSSMMFSCYKEGLSIKNLRGTKNILSGLPKYLANAGTVDVDNSGKTVRKTDNVKSYSEPSSKNQAMVASNASTEDAAEVVGRGYTQAYQYFDECEFIKFIDIIVKVSGLAFNTASINAEKNGSGHCRIFTTTPGDLGNKKACQRAMKIVKDSLPFDESMYDMPVDELKQMVKLKTSFRVVYIEFGYKQLGLGEEWFINACSTVGNDVNKIRREILLQRFSGSSDSPFTPDEIEELVQNKKKPLFIKKLSRIYEILFYEKPKKKRLYFISVDPSDGTGSDNYAITVLDPYILQVVAEFRSPYMTIHGCNDLVNYMVDNYFPKALIIVERNRNGGAVIEVMKQSKLRGMIYSSPEANSDNNRIRDRLDDNGFIKEEFIRNKFFGANTTTSTRQVMMNLLLDSVHFAKNIVNTEYIVDDITKLVVKNDKIQAMAGEHDDSVMSWLIALYIYYYGERLERYGFVKGAVPTDIEEDDEYIKAKKLYQSPEIKKQFPTLYSYYQSKLATLKATGKKQKTSQSIQEVTIGGLQDIAGNQNISEDIVPELDVQIDGVPLQKTEDTWKKSILAKFRSLSKP